MRQVATGIAGLLLSVSAAGQSLQPAELSQPAEPNPITTTLPTTNVAELETARINNAISNARENWRFLNPETEGRLREILQGVKLDKLTAQPAEQFYVSDYRVLTMVEFKPSEGRGPVEVKEFGDLQNTAQAQLGGLKDLRESGFISMNQVVSLVMNSGNFRLGILSYGGPRSNFHPDPGAFALGPEDPKTRQEIWGKVQSTLDLATRLAMQPSPNERAEMLQAIEGLRGYYAGSGQESMARLTQGLIVYLSPNAATVRKYADMGRIDENDQSIVPASLRDTVREVNYLTRNVPSPKDIVALAERVKDTECPQYPLGLLALEQQTQVYPPAVVELAHLEIRDAIRYAGAEWKASTDKSVDDGATIVRKYFEEYFQNEYNFGDHTPGLSGGISLRRTDCSTRAVLAYEMLSGMGFKTGTESILAYKDGKPLPGAAAHIYNFIEAPDGTRVFFDFCRKPGEQYRFESTDAIKKTYAGGQAEIEVRVEHSSTKPGDLYGLLVREPIIDDVRDFCAAFQKHGGTLTAFLFDSPTHIPAMHKLCAYSQEIDRIFGKKEMDAWRTGTQESLRSIFANFFD